MPIKKNNNEAYKAFAIGTKITYNDKLYEVVESVNCGDCSIASICSSSVLSPSDRNDDTLSKDKRINIFGACSKRKGYVIPYNFPLNTRRGFRTIYYLMRLSNHDMTTVIKDIIGVRRAGINFINNICDKLKKENDNILNILLRGG